MIKKEIEARLSKVMGSRLPQLLKSYERVGCRRGYPANIALVVTANSFATVIDYDGVLFVFQTLAGKQYFYYRRLAAGFQPVFLFSL